MPYKLNPFTGKFDLGGDEVVPIYEESIWTSFQTQSKTTTSTNIGSGTCIAVPIYVPKEVIITNVKVEVTALATNPTNCNFAIYDVINGVITNRLFYQVFQATATGLYTFTLSLKLKPGIYAYAVSQDIIIGYRSFSLSDNVLSVDSNIGTNAFISGKSKASNTTPNPFGIQANYNGNLPLAIFKIQP